ncbi:hypothetical protein Pla108_34910 [Botrimarina colliarenosi]|uniref:DUF4864 domain-containing protein n=1 Tax=Botrimarina colliarenosi TaxID=2528001 RepID=A0A5C6A7Q0_9BACT|nr:DUF4864 domain-containing protein [Botrimarina colliarenosi]TWT95345.1 hypothetical protein Pla108_34910 [Botrimarina colliarenosi]
MVLPSTRWRRRVGLSGGGVAFGLLLSLGSGCDVAGNHAGSAPATSSAKSSSPSPAAVTDHVSDSSLASDWDLSAAEVVQEQMTALAAWHEKPDASKRAFSFASPGNQAVTGPLSKFEGLVESEAYGPLTSNQGFVVGESVEKEGAATVLVTLIGPTGELVAYRFYLSRQESEPHRRWMTDAVYRFRPAASGDVSPTFPTI